MLFSLFSKISELVSSSFSGRSSFKVVLFSLGFTLTETDDESEHEESLIGGFDLFNSC